MWSSSYLIHFSTSQFSLPPPALHSFSSFSHELLHLVLLVCGLKLLMVVASAAATVGRMTSVDGSEYEAIALSSLSAAAAAALSTAISSRGSSAWCVIERHLSSKIFGYVVK